ncbi:hypothetical protein Tco_0804603 [Tanacetum coccineum]|uniref:Uncharacterized protein n=1 Tax=Tanacetum coccineum TaxID=301880 RepID=A0ABQ5A4R7_9ASTR
MDSMIPIGQNNTLAEYMILSGADNRPPMLDKDLYDSWKRIMELHMQNREHGRMILESVKHGLLIWPTIEENRVTGQKKYVELSATEKIQADCDLKATNIILQGLPSNICSLERECKLYDAFDKFAHIKGESLHQYYLRFTQLINDMNIYKMKLEQFQVNTKFLNSLPPEWSKFMTDVKLIQDYALWEVIEYGNSWVPIPITAPESGPSTPLKMTVPSTTEEKICKKNDVKARSPSSHTLPNEHHLPLTNSEVSNDKTCSKTCLQNYEALKKQYDDLLVKLDDTAFKAATYKRGLSILEAQVVKYKESEVLFSEEIALLKRSVGHKDYLMGLVKTELEKVKEEKEGVEFKLAKFEKSSKDLDDLLASQVTDKNKRGFGYNAVPSPHPLILNRPTPLDLSYSGLEEFQQPEINWYGPRDSISKPTTVCDRESNNSKENTDDLLTQKPKSVTETSSVVPTLKVDKKWKEKLFNQANNVRLEEPKKARENTDAPIIEDWVSDDEEEVESIPKEEKKANVPIATEKRKLIRYAEMYRSQKSVLMRTALTNVKNAKPLSTASSSLDFKVLMEIYLTFGEEQMEEESLVKFPKLVTCLVAKATSEGINVMA